MAVLSKKFSEYSIATPTSAGTVLFYDGNGVKQTAIENLLDSVIYTGAAHNGIYRGKNLGTAVTQAQWNAISDGSFKDLYIGDYWKINNVNWRIAAFDYWYNYGDTACTTHHVVIVPDSNLYNAQMQNTSSGQYEAGAANTTKNGYAGSDMRGTTSGTGVASGNLAQAITLFNNAFGSTHILSHREYLTSAAADKAYATAGAWYDSTVDLMNEVMVYGTDFFTPHNSLGTIPNTHTIGTSQLPLFALNHSLICNRSWWWLRDVVSASGFAGVAGGGGCASDGASLPLGVRPAAAIKA